MSFEACGREGLALDEAADGEVAGERGEGVAVEPVDEVQRGAAGGVVGRGWLGGQVGVEDRAAAADDRVAQPAGVAVDAGGAGGELEVVGGRRQVALELGHDRARERGDGGGAIEELRGAAAEVDPAEVEAAGERARAPAREAGEGHRRALPSPRLAGQRVGLGDAIVGDRDREDGDAAAGRLQGPQDAAARGEELAGARAGTPSPGCGVT